MLLRICATSFFILQFSFCVSASSVSQFPVVTAANSPRNYDGFRARNDEHGEFQKSRQSRSDVTLGQGGGDDMGEVFRTMQCRTALWTYSCRCGRPISRHSTPGTCYPLHEEQAISFGETCGVGMQEQ